MSKRIEKFFDEAVGTPIDVQSTFNRAMAAVGHLIDNVGRRIEWHEAENRRLTRAALAKGEKPPAPISLKNELETIGRIIETLQSPRLDEFRRGDPDAGAKEIVRILKLAREEHENVKAETPVKEGGKDTVSVEESGDEGEGDKISQNPTPEAKARIERGPEISRLCLSRGKVRRGSG